MTSALRVTCLLLGSSGDDFGSTEGSIRWNSQQQLLGHGSHIPGHKMDMVWNERKKTARMHPVGDLQ